MKRKRFVKLLMSCGMSRNDAQKHVSAYRVNLRNTRNGAGFAMLMLLFKKDKEIVFAKPEEEVRT